MCGIGAVALYLFYRFNFTNEPWINMSSNDAWYGVPLFRGRDGTGVSYGCQYSEISKIYDELGIPSTKLTHMGRLFGSISMSEAGVDGLQIKCAGRWNSAGAVGLSYLSHAPPRDAIQALAGFQVGERYLLLRDLVAPPEALCRKVFPWLEESEASLPSNGVVTGKSFLRLMRELRRTLLQDAAELINDVSVCDSCYYCSSSLLMHTC
jgi:hypothetical protein